MKRHPVILAYSNPELARTLTPELGDASFEFRLASSLEQVRSTLRVQHVGCVIADLEVMSFAQIKALQWEHGLHFVCVHRNADDQMWMDSLRAGAIDCCYPDDTATINRALHASKHAMAAAGAAAA